MHEKVTVKKPKAEIRGRGLAGYSGLRKPELISMSLNNDGGGSIGDQHSYASPAGSPNSPASRSLEISDQIAALNLQPSVPLPSVPLVADLQGIVTPSVIQ